MAQLEEKKVRFISMRVKLLVGFTIVFSAVFAAAYYWFYQFGTNMALDLISEDMVNTLQAGIDRVDVDGFAALGVRAMADETDLEGDPAYETHQALLDTVHRLEPRAYPYTWVRGDPAVDNEVVFIGDIWRITDPEAATAFGERYVTEGSMIEGLAGLWEDREIYEDAWGAVVISAYAPIVDAAGTSVGGMGLDFRADYVRKVQQEILSQVVVSFAIAYLALFVLVYIISSTLTRPITRLTGVAQGVADGNYDQDLAPLYGGGHQDEVDTLARVFELMIGKVRTREESLKREVQQLRIEVDVAKKARQVAEITESDYFQELRIQARVLRAQHARPAGDDDGAEEEEKEAGD